MLLILVFSFLFWFLIRFIEWMGCCCCGSYDCGNVKEEKSEENQLTTLCKDDYLKHPVRTKACKELAQLPASVPLSCGFSLSLSLYIYIYIDSKVMFQIQHM